MKPYADTNFLLRLYLDYEETDAALARIAAGRQRGHVLPISWLHRIEFANATQLILFQSRAGGLPHVTPEAAAVALHDFDSDLISGGALSEVNLSSVQLVKECRSLSVRRTATVGCRTYDLIHVTAAIMLKCDTFWSFDVKASKLAKLEGLDVL